MAAPHLLGVLHFCKGQWVYRVPVACRLYHTCSSVNMWRRSCFWDGVVEVIQPRFTHPLASTEIIPAMSLFDSVRPHDTPSPTLGQDEPPPVPLNHESNRNPYIVRLAERHTCECTGGSTAHAYVRIPDPSCYPSLGGASLEESASGSPP